MTSKFSAVSLFAGCGGSDLGLRNAGIETVWANEISESACALYEEVMSSQTVEHADVRHIDLFPKSDILAGCYPCQGYSQAGRRTVTDSINYLYREFDRALRQIKPLAFIVENVNGMRFGRNQKLLNNQLVRFRLAGYRVNWKVLDAKDYGLPQSRKRLFIVGIRSREKIYYTFPMPSYGDSGRRPYRNLKQSIWNLRKHAQGTYNTEPFHWYYLSRNRRPEWSGISPCIVANSRHLPLHPDSPQLKKIGPDQWEFIENRPARRLGYLEAAAIQGFDNPFAFRSRSVDERIKAIGNAVPPPLFTAVANQLVSLLK